MAIHHLPPEILRDILLRVPTETLSKARFVNKFWLQFISSSDFVRAHLKKSEEDNTFSDHRVLFDVHISGLLLEQFSVEYRDSSSINLVDFGYPESSSHSVWFVGSCNGLICVVSKERRIILLNPCTGKYHKLPPLDLKPPRGTDPHISYGFGYDESNDDYKVVAVGYCSVVKVYSLKSNSWKRIQDFKGGVICSGKLASGKLYWHTNYEIGGYRQRRIVSFDVGGEVFEIIEPPVDYFCTRLDVLRGCICLLVDYDRSHADMWVRKEYGSWTKMVTVSYTNAPKRLRLCSLLPNGEILFSVTYNNRSFVVYNPNDGSFKFLDKASLNPSYGPPLIYVQSLVSPTCIQVREKESKAGVKEF